MQVLSALSCLRHTEDYELARVGFGPVTVSEADEPLFEATTCTCEDHRQGAGHLGR